MTSPGHIAFIVNPAAGRGKVQHLLPRLRRILEHSGLDHEFHLTSGPGDATQLARKASERSSIIVAVGGDGTVNETASGVTGTNAALAVLREGSGNDFARMIGAPADPQKLLRQLQSPVIERYDTGTVRLTHADGVVTERFFFNSIGIGFDAAVAKNVASIRNLRGIPLYLTALLKTMKGYRPHPITVRYNGKAFSDDFFLLCAGNGKWEGGGFMLTPIAVPDDGMFEICCVTGRSIAAILPILPFVMIGKHIGKPHITMFTSNAVTVECADGFPVHGDGEILGWKVVSAEIGLRPRGLTVVVSHNR